MNYRISLGMDILVEPLRATLQTKVKANSVKQEFEKQDELKRSALRAVAALLSIPDSGMWPFLFLLTEDFRLKLMGCKLKFFKLKGMINATFLPLFRLG